MMKYADTDTLHINLRFNNSFPEAVYWLVTVKQGRSVPVCIRLWQIIEEVSWQVHRLRTDIL